MADATALEGKIPTMRLLVHPRCDHAPRHPHPELAAKQIAAFLRHSH
jgi:hypothetical protein